MSSKQPINQKTLKLFWRFTRPYKRWFAIGTAGSSLALLVQDIIPPFVISLAFNRLQQSYSSGEPITLNAMLPYVLAYIGLISAGFVLWRVQVYFVWRYEIEASRNIIIHIFNHLQAQGSNFHANKFSGGLVSQTNKFVSAYEKIMDDFTWSIVTGTTAFVASFVLLAITIPYYAAMLFVFSAVYLKIMYKRHQRQQVVNQQIASSESDRTAKLADNIANSATVRSFANEKLENNLFTKQADHTRAASYNLMRVQLRNELVNHSLTATINITAFTTGIIAVTNFGLPAGSLFLAITYTAALSRRLWESGRIMRSINRSFGDASDMTRLLQLQPEIKNPKNPKKLSVKHGRIDFNQIDFSYEEHSGSSTQVFKNLTLCIKGGQKVGLVGKSGGGKTTITKLLLRFSDIQGGTIKIDGQDITEVTQEDLRKHIAYVPQEPLLFHRTIRENICYARPDASDQEIFAVAKNAHAHEFIKQLPNGYDTLVGERGIKLSGGQRQRIAIARAMLKNAPILILDEATSALDSESENLIQAALWQLMQGRTAIVIAHRLSTIQKMDNILVLDDGEIVEQGTHKELTRQNGTYAELWAHQSGGFIEE